MTFNTEVTIADIPWQKLTTAYGRAADVPMLLHTENYTRLAELIEHQGTLWQVTPWVLLFMLRQLKVKPISDVNEEEIHLYIAVATSLELYKENIAEVQPITPMTELLAEEYLWPEDEEEDELAWEDEEPIGYDQQAFGSYFYYSRELLQYSVPYFQQIAEQSSHTAAELAKQLLQQL